MNLSQRVKSWFNWGAEAQPRGPFMGVGELGGLFPIEPLGDGWQRNLRPMVHDAVAARFAAISLIADAIALLPGGHYRRLPNGSKQPVTGTPLARWFIKPNSMQTRSEFMNAGVRLLLSKGNAVAFGVRDDDDQPIATYWAEGYSIYIDPESGAVFYSLRNTNAGPRVAPDFLIPARDVMHWRINADARDPLQGVSPLVHCASSLAINSTLSAFLVSFLNNRASPSYILTTDVQMNANQMQQLRQAWQEQSQQLASGGTPILGWGLKPNALGVVPGDELLVDTFNLSVEDIARAFRIPKSLLGINETAANVEQLINSWLATGLASLIDMIELSVDRFFNLPESQFSELDTRELSRMDYLARVDAAAKGATSGVFSADEARAQLGYPPIPGGYGAMPTQQQQQVPIDLLHDLHESQLAPEPAPAVPTEPTEPEPPEPKSVDVDVVRALVRSMMIDKRLAA